MMPARMDSFHLGALAGAGGTVLTAMVLAGVVALGVLAADKDTPEERARAEAWRAAPIARICPDGTRVYLFEGTLRVGGWGDPVAPGVSAADICPALAVRS